MKPSSIARRYAEAAYDVAVQDGNTDVWLRDLRAADDVLQGRSLALYFKNPEVPAEDKLRALQELLPHVYPHVLNLLRLLVTRHRLHLLPSVIQHFEDLDREAKGIVEAYVTVARPVDEGETAIIKQRLSSLTGKTVELQTSVDPGILGGIVVRIGDKLIDASVAGRLERLRQELAV